MLIRRLRAPSPAFVISLIALFIALGGTTYAATGLPKNSVGTKQLKTNAVTGPKIKKGAVTAAKINTKGLTVPNALHATSADTATSATNATNATTAANANALQGKAASAFAPSASEAAHVVGAAGEPAYENGWGTSALSPADEGASFYKDPWGIVHLQGNAGHSGASTATIFTLPAGYRPAKNLYLAVYGSGGTSAFLQISPDGTVNPFGPATGFYGLTNITFRDGL